jgi:peptidoglycan-associated lipoprotein
MVAAPAVIGLGPDTADLNAETKGGIMVTRAAYATVMSLLLVGLIIISGCAKRPATTAASAAAPAPAPRAASPGPAPAAPAAPSGGATARPSAPATAAPAAPRPSPKEFTAVAALKDVFFDFDKYDIRPEDARTLDANATWLKQNADNLVLIEGHCDERGTNEYNLALGERRAKTTMNYLVSQGIQANRITIISYGEERPSCNEKNESCWSKNRRAHFLVKPR